VVSHGAVRTAEVTARFTLDAMPASKWPSTRSEHRTHQRRTGAKRRQQVRAKPILRRHGRRGAFQPARLDGNHSHHGHQYCCGFLIGVFQQGVPFQQALKTYTILTVATACGHHSVASRIDCRGIVVTRAASDTLWAPISRQMFRTARPLWIVSGCLLSLALIPGMPKIPFIVLGGATVFAAWKMKPVEAEAAAAKVAAKKRRKRLPSIPWMRRSNWMI